MVRLLVALDSSDSSRLALQRAVQIAERAPPVELMVLTVIPPQPDEVSEMGEFEHACDELRRMMDVVRAGHPLPAGVTVNYVAVRGSPAEEIANQARLHKSDAVVIGTHGRRGIDRLLLGSVAERVMRMAPCSVLAVK